MSSIRPLDRILLHKSMVKLNYVEKKLLKKVSLHDFKDNNLAMNTVIGKYRLKDSKEYRDYNRLAQKVQGLVAVLRKLPSSSQVRQDITREMLDKFYRLGLIPSGKTLEEVEKCGVSEFAERRLTTMLLRLKMAGHMDHAVSLVTHGHISIGSDVTSDPATLVTREMEDLIQWSKGSKYKRHIASFNDEEDDYALTNA